MHVETIGLGLFFRPLLIDQDAYAYLMTMIIHKAEDRSLETQ